jgi:hypothetical protein
MFRVYAKQFHPVLQLYVSPVNLDPAAPELPLSTPDSYSRQIAQAIGPFYTQGIAEDTAVYRAGYFDLQEYLAQSRLVAEDQSAILRHAFSEFRTGLFFFYFSTLDQNSHMLWGKHEDELLKSYQSVDRAIGWVAARAGSATIMVMSDHGFTRFDRAVHLNSWLRSEGFLGFDGRHRRRRRIRTRRLVEDPGLRHWSQRALCELARPREERHGRRRDGPCGAVTPDFGAVAGSARPG